MTYRTNTADTFHAGWAQGEADALLFIAAHRSDAVRTEHARQVESSQRHGLRRPMDTDWDEGRRTAYLVTLTSQLG